MKQKKHAIVIGANGLIGSELTKQLLLDETYEMVSLIVRRPVELEHEKLDLRIVDFRDLHKDWDLFKCDDMFYCLGTTRSDTPKKADYYKVEHDYCINVAKISHHNKVKRFLYISSSGANSKSIFYYLKIRGEVEEAISAIGFESLHIFRPYVLIGKREMVRFGEGMAQFFLKVFNFMMVGFLKNFKGMPAPLLAKAMLHYAHSDKKGVFIHSNRELHELFSKK
jgi:uncharacterized protein YbjT (DUF2867 family)